MTRRADVARRARHGAILPMRGAPETPLLDRIGIAAALFGIATVVAPGLAWLVPLIARGH